jgi:Tfp pilus assembly protein PilN
LSARPTGNPLRLPPDLNLAARPARNRQPVARVAVLLAVAALAIGAVDLYLFGRYRAASRSTQLELDDVRARSLREIEDARRVEEELRRTDVEALNVRVDYLNRRIAERTFPWGRLFDGLAAVLPRGVRLIEISRLSIAEPVSAASRQRRSRQATDDFALHLQGVAETDADLLRFVDALFQSPAFADVDLRRERQEPQGIRFEIGVTYRAAAIASEAPVAATSAPAGAPSPDSAAAAASTAEPGR